ncbi:unnamed protein product [marine sediment metagenome]|uniref:Uncharacterized protein n=1 Tax=marine sediment metagenome TaxID=412755 RepID=X1AFK9_9ZZZZ
MSWKEQLEKLPLVLGGKPLADDECIEGSYGNGEFTASHEYAPPMGATYHFSFSGSVKDREKLIAELIAELGIPHTIDAEDPQLWHYFWKSPSNEIPETEVHKTLGRERIHQICQQHGLVQEDERIIDEILAVYRILMFRVKERAIFVAHRLKDMKQSRKSLVLKAIGKIIREFARKRAGL